MKTFLDCFAEYIYETFEGDFRNLSIVFPNRRPALFLENSFRNQISKPLILPKILTIRELVTEWSDYETGDRLSLLFRLFEVYGRYFESGDFEDFLNFGEVLLRDFNEIDHSLADGERIFKNISDLKALGDIREILSEDQIKSIEKFWEAWKDSSKSHRKNYLDFWNKLSDVYQEFRKILMDEGLVYQGLALRQLILSFQNQEVSLPENKVYCFCGFFALTPAEKELFSIFKPQSYYFWDYDDYYLSNRLHESAEILRKNLNAFPAPEDFRLKYPSLFKQFAERKEIYTYAVPSETAQAKYLAEMLNHEKAENLQNLNSAVVLSDESLLQSLLASLNPGIGPVNVTMGYPLSSLPFYSLFGHLSDLLKTSIIEEDQILLRKMAFSKYLKHDFVRTLADNEELIKTCERSKLEFISERIWSKDVFLNSLLKAENSSKLLESFILYFQKYLQDRKPDDFLTDAEKLQIEALIRVIKSMESLEQLLEKYQVSLKNDVLIRLLLKLLLSEKLAFEGEPLEGLQLMGKLESRLLDFPTVYIVSLNEGNWPKQNSLNSFIPYSLRHAFNLPLVDHDDAIFAYYFYRLIQRAGKVHIFYQPEKDENISKGEMSRFINQLKYDSPHELIENKAAYPMHHKGCRKIVVKKDSALMMKLNRYREGEGKYLSPSAVNVYLDCSLKFYYRYILGLKESDAGKSLDSPDVFGNIFHKTMEDIYKPYIGKKIEKKDIDALLKEDQKIQKYILKAIEEIYQDKQKTEKLRGKEELLVEIIIRYVKQVLRYDRSFDSLEIVGLENEYRFQMDVNECKIAMGGVIDRIDLVDGFYRVIDYKTGAVGDYKLSNIESLFDRDYASRKKEIFQVFMYLLMLESNQFKEKVYPGIYGVREIFNADFHWNIEKNKKALGDDLVSLRKEFRDSLTKLLEEMFNPDVDFVQTQLEERCKYCPYIEMCMK